MADARGTAATSGRRRRACPPGQLPGQVPGKRFHPIQVEYFVRSMRAGAENLAGTISE